MYYFFLFTVLVAITLSIVGAVFYSDLIKKDKLINAAWRELSQLLKRRYELVPHFINAVEKYNNQDDREVLLELASLKDAAAKAINVEEKVELEDYLSHAIRTLFSIIDQEAENYPNIEDDQALINIDNDFANIEENLISTASRYNILVKEYNETLNTFPITLIAKKFGFKQKIFFGDVMNAPWNPDEEQIEEDNTNDSEYYQ